MLCGLCQGNAVMDRLLIIDDDVELCELVSEYLSPEGFVVEGVHDGRSGLQRALSGDHVLIIIDIMLPGMNGLDVLRAIRAQSAIPVLMLTARGDDVDRIVGLELGADDYLPKPHNPRELLARIRAILRRYKHAGQDAHVPHNEVIVVGDIEADIGGRVARKAGEPIELTSAEFDLLVAFLRKAGQPVTREELFEAVLGREAAPLDRSIDMHVSNLRKKLGQRYEDFERIKAVRGIGYVYTKPVNAEDGRQRTNHSSA